MIDIIWWKYKTCKNVGLFLDVWNQIIWHKNKKLTKLKIQQEMTSSFWQERHRFYIYFLIK